MCGRSMWQGSAFSTLRRGFLAAAALCLTLSSGAWAQHSAHDLKRVDKIELFLQHLGKVVQVEPRVYESFLLEYELAQTLAELGAPHPEPLLGDFLRRSVGKLHGEYGDALKQMQGERLSGLKAALEGLESNADLYLSAHCRLHLAELDLAAGRYREAVRRAEEIIARDRRYLLDDHRACELVALGFRGLDKPLLEYLQYALLLVDFKELPPQVEARARERVAELEKTVGKPLTTVASWMGSIEKWIDAFQTSDEPTQAKQVEVTSALVKLIEYQEARERNTCGNCGSCGGCNGACRGGQPKGNRSSRPAEVSRLVQAEGSVNLHGVSRGDPAKVWGLLKDRQGAEALQGFRAKLPERYQKLLEQYYKGLSRKSTAPGAASGGTARSAAGGGR